MVTTLIETSLLEGPVFTVEGPLPFRIQIRADNAYMTELLAPELYAPLAACLMKGVFHDLRRHAQYRYNCPMPPRELLDLIEGGGLLKGGMRDLPRSFIGNDIRCWQMPDEDTLQFDSGRVERQITLKRFADDHFMTLEHDSALLWLVRVRDDIDD